jgi:exopolyphosphatase/pppGpp-phosphohydrolase
MDFYKGLTTRQKIQLNSAYELARKCNIEEHHAEHVAFLSLKLFDELSSLHELGEPERFWLLIAALLHDIGMWTEGGRAHHKIAVRMILSARDLKFNDKERLMIGSIARYHRKALPSDSHDHFAALSMEEKGVVTILAGLLRLADGLDFTHSSRISDLHCAIAQKKISINCIVTYPPIKLEKQSALKKSDLLKKYLNREIKISTKEITKYLTQD